MLLLLSAVILSSCSRPSKTLQIYQTSQAGDKLADKGRVSSTATRDSMRASIVIHPELQYQEITGFGGAFTESSASVLGKLSKAKRTEVSGVISARTARHTASPARISTAVIFP